MPKIHLLIIDPQFDFCNPRGALYVNGADEDSKRLANFIKRCKDKIDDIHVTLDSHHLLDVAHPLMWINSSGQHPNPFTIISHADLIGGLWTTINPAWNQRMIDYTKALESGGRYPLCIWPPHCLIGSEGYAVQKDVFEALLEWEKSPGQVHYVTKGSNMWVEHYSAVKAEVSDPDDDGTLINFDLIKTLQEADIVAITGQALSHCVANTVRDIADNFGDENIKKLYLLEDTSSNVTGFESLGTDFVKDLKARGMNVVKSTDFLI